MQGMEVNGAVRPIFGSLGVKRLTLRSSRCAYDWRQSAVLDAVAKEVFNGYPFECNVDNRTAGKSH